MRVVSEPRGGVPKSGGGKEGCWLLDKRKLVAGLLATVVLGVGLAPSAAAQKCQPGKHGNPAPGFKPAPCPPP